MLFQPFVEKFIGNLDGQYPCLNLYGFDGLKPCAVTLWVDILANDFQTIVPNYVVVIYHTSVNMFKGHFFPLNERKWKAPGGH